MPRRRPLSDLIFSPMHRLAHHPRHGPHHHKEHHEYTNQLTALVLYRRAARRFSDAGDHDGGRRDVHPAALARRSARRQALLERLAAAAVIFNTLLSDAHDVRCARLMAPLADSLNFVADHYEHHLSPAVLRASCEPSDVIWDTDPRRLHRPQAGLRAASRRAGSPVSLCALITVIIRHFLK